MFNTPMFFGSGVYYIDISSTQISSAGWQHFNSAAVTQTTPTGTYQNSAIYHAISFDNKASWKAFKSVSTIDSPNNSTTIATSDMTSNTAPSPNVVSATSIWDSSHPAWHVFDRVNSSDADGWYSQDSSASPQNLMFDFGAGNTKIINKYCYLSVNETNYDCGPTAWKLQGSNNPNGVTNANLLAAAETAEGWTTIDTQSISAPTAANQQKGYYTSSNAVAYRYYRMRITAWGGGYAYTGIGELKLVEATYTTTSGWVTIADYVSSHWRYNNAGTMTQASPDTQAGALAQATAQSAYQWTKTNIEAMTHANWEATGGWSSAITTIDWATVLISATDGDPNGANNTSESYATATNGTVISSSGSGSKAYAFDQNSGTYWVADTANTGYIGYDFGGSPKVINKYFHYICGYYTNAPKTWKLQGSQDNSNWDDLGSQQTVTYGSGNVWSDAFTFTNSTAYRYYRMNITAVQTSGYSPAVGEICLVAVTLTTTAPTFTKSTITYEA
jgi:hypothetical protein